MFLRIRIPNNSTQENLQLWRCELHASEFHNVNGASKKIGFTKILNFLA